MSSYYMVRTDRGCRAVTADERVQELENENARLRAEAASWRRVAERLEEEKRAGSTSAPHPVGTNR